MSMFTHSIRWRLQLWLAFFLVCILSGFGITAYQLHRTNQLNQIDHELERRVAALGGDPSWSCALRSSRGTPPFLGGEEAGRLLMMTTDARRDAVAGQIIPMPRGSPESWPGPREIRLPPPVLNLFEEGETNAFYFVIWSRDGTRIKGSTNAPVKIPLPERENPDTATQIRMRAPFRECFYFTSPGECILAGRSVATDLVELNRFALWLITAASAVLCAGTGRELVAGDPFDASSRGH